MVMQNTNQIGRSTPQKQPSARGSAEERSPQQNINQAPALTLPTGGGAIRGIDEKFQINPTTGSGTITIPIAISSARQGFGPQLALSYDSGSGSGPFGLGWHLSLPQITRKTDKGLPTYQDGDESDVFILSGAEDLVPVLVDGDDRPNRHSQTRTVDGTAYKVQRYRPRVEGLFARIERWTRQQTGEIHWRSISRDNVTTLYGQTGESRIIDPANPLRIFSWLICESYDDKGNAIIYRYKTEDSANVDRSQVHERNRTELSRSANRYVKGIHYGNRAPRQTDEDLRQRTDWMFKVVFDYGEGHLQQLEEDEEGRRFVQSAIEEQQSWPVRQDPMSGYRAGFEVRTYRLCRRVLMFHHFPNELAAADCLVSAKHFGYNEGPINTVMTSVIHSGYLRQEDNIYQERSLPPVEFEYSQAEIQNEIHEIDSDSLENLPVGLSGLLYRWVDLDGEGISGILSEQGGGWYYKPNLGNAHFAPMEEVVAKPSLAALNQGQQLLDLAGDGQLDLVTFDSSTPGFYERTFNRSWAGHRAFISVPSVDWHDPNLRFVDLTGDGHADVLVTENEIFIWYPSLGEEGFAPSLHTPQSEDDETGPRLVFADGTQSIYLADMSGDGLTDLVRIRNGEVCYWPNLGYGHFGAKVTMDNAPWLDAPDSFEPLHILLADVDGSGLTDILYLGSDQVAVYFNQAGNSWAAAQIIDQLPYVDNLSDVSVTDLLGKGTACLVWSSPLPGEMNRAMRYIDLMGGQKPHLLIGSRNNLGAETRVQYASSTRFYLEDKAAGRPWITRLPFPVQVVERTETYDRISGNRFVSRYLFHDGYFDGIEREFRGFGLVEQIDTEEFAALNESDLFPTGVNIDEASHIPPILTRSWFHTGAYIGGLRISRLFQDDYYREPGLTDEQFQRQLLPDTVMPTGLTPEAEREAARSLKGVMLRQEVYALDGTDAQPHPYTVTEQNFTIQPLQPHGSNRHAVFFTHARETIIYHYERNPADPRLGHALTLAVDNYGNVLQAAAVGYGRRHPDAALQPAGQEKQAQLLITCAENSFTNAVEEDDHYRTPLPSEVLSYELTGLTPDPEQLRFSFPEIQNAAQSATIIAYHQTSSAGLQKRVMEQTRVRYRPDDMGANQNDALALLPLGVLEPLGLSGESYTLAFTLDHLELIFGDRITEAMLGDEGRYVHFDDDDNWWIPSGRIFMSPNDSDDAAQELAFAPQHFFMARRFHDAFGQTSFVTYDEHDLLLLDTRDPLGNRVTAGERDDDGIVSPRINYRVLQPELMTDPNGNRSTVAFDVLGMVAGTAVMGKTSENAGDSLDDFQAQLDQGRIDAFLTDPRGPIATELLGNATTRIVYDETRFLRQEQPAVAATIARETHISDLSDGEQTAVQVSLAYSDGFGRIIQYKVQAEPGPVPRLDEDGLIVVGPDGQPQMTENDVSPRWTVSGWTIFNNKGKPVKQYEPFFSAGHPFEFGVTVGVSPTQFYDPAGRVVATLHPDHTWEKVVFVPWRQENWDVNDTVLLDPAGDENVGDYFRRLLDADYQPTWHALRTDPDHASEALIRWPDAQQRQDQASAAAKAAAHAATPAIAHFDSLGRPFLSIADNGPGGQYQTHTELDIESNPLRIIDDRGNPVMTYQVEVGGNTPVSGYGMLGRPLYENSMEAGECRVLVDVGGKPIRSWDSRGQILRTTYDQLQRPTHLFVQRENEPELLAGMTVYGEGHPGAEGLNLRGQAYRVYDGAGAVTSRRFDFRGNLLESSRQVAREYHTTIDWSPLAELSEIGEIEVAAETRLEAGEIFITETEHDALNRPVAITTPDNSVTLPVYNEANLLELMAVRLPGAAQTTPFVANIDYNARGQRELITYATTDGTNFTTTYSYDPHTFRLTRLNTVRHRDGHNLQDMHLTYDPAGNITSIRDNALPTVFFSNTQVEPHSDYTYDALYRLIRAEGREHAAQNNLQRDAVDFEPIIGITFPNSPEALQRYVEEYAYDGVGNILSMRHRGGAVQRWTRRYRYTEASNHLLATSLPGDGPNEFSAPYSYDAHGNMTTMPHLPMMRWDFKDQLQATSRQMVTEGTPEITYYVYDAGGQRVRKVTERQALGGQTPTRRHERIYVGGFEVYREYNGDGSTVTLERETLHVMDDQRRISQIDTRTQGNDDAPTQSRRFQLSNHLGSAILEVDEQANVISYEEYHPYGTSAYRAGRSATEVSLKRYRYTGKERDEENGLYFHGARYYACWLGRWTAIDPKGIEESVNAYFYVTGNPIKFDDPGGGRKRKKGALGGIRFSPESQISAQQMLEMIQKNEKMEPWMRDLFTVEDNRLALKSSNIKLKRGGKFEITAPAGSTLPKWFEKTVSAILSKEWYFTTGTSLVSGVTEHGIGIDVDIERMPVSLPEQETGIKLGATFISEARRFAHSKIPLQDPDDPLLRRSDEGLIVAANRIRYSDKTLGDIALDEDFILETFFHELSAHAAQYSEGKMAESAHKSTNYRLGLLPMSPADVLSKEVYEFFGKLKLDLQKVEDAAALGRIKSVGVITQVEEYKKISEQRQKDLSKIINVLERRGGAQR
jgi:RHS repeat-associated protein